MITSIRLVNFKNFADETLRVGPFTVIVGANASGKSNIRDAFRFLHGIGRGYTLAEIVGGKHGVGGQLEWEPIRGAPNEITRFGLLHHNMRPSTFSLDVELDLACGKAFYSITVEFSPFSPDGFLVSEEELKTTSGRVYKATKTGDNRLSLEGKNGPLPYSASASQPTLTQAFFLDSLGLYYDVSEVPLLPVFKGMRFFELDAQHMREPSFPGAAKLGDFGENLPTVLKAICADDKRRMILADWLRELTPMDVKNFEFPAELSGRISLRILEADGTPVSTYSASDGTLRFLAMLAALLDEQPNGLYFFEEIDTGIHPARLALLLELIERQTAKGKLQVVTTTHAPDLLTFANDSTFENMSVVCRLEDSHDAIIRPVAEVPNAKELRTSQGGLGRLLSEGWMETALAFTENSDEADGEGE